MRKVILLAIMLAMALALAAPAYALYTGTSGADTFNGTAADEDVSLLAGGDTAYGAGGNDDLMGQGGADLIYGGLGNDNIIGSSGDDLALNGEEGDDVIDSKFGPNGALEGNAETIRCGTGYDIVVAGPEDTVSADCEQQEEAVVYANGVHKAY